MLTPDSGKIPKYLRMSLIQFESVWFGFGKKFHFGLFLESQRLFGALSFTGRRLYCLLSNSFPFQQFYWVHFFTYWMLAIGSILHCQNFWKWMFIPLFIYSMEKIANINFIKRTLYGKFRIINYKVLPSNVSEILWADFSIIKIVIYTLNKIASICSQSHGLSGLG